MTKDSLIKLLLELTGNSFGIRIQFRSVASLYSIINRIIGQPDPEELCSNCSVQDSSLIVIDDEFPFNTSFFFGAIGTVVYIKIQRSLLQCLDKAGLGLGLIIQDTIKMVIKEQE